MHRPLRLVLALALALVPACGKNDKPPPPTSGSPGAKPESGPGARGGGGAGGGDPAAQARALFEGTCAMCHGMTGRGDGQMAQSLNPKPRNYTDPAWQSSVTDDDIKKTILEGGQAVGKSASMPSFKPQLGAKPEVLTELVKLIRGFGAKQ
jgi:cytochrome c553